MLKDQNLGTIALIYKNVPNSENDITTENFQFKKAHWINASNQSTLHKYIQKKKLIY